MGTTAPVRPPAEKKRVDGPGSGGAGGNPVSVIVMNDNHNTFEGVAAALAQFIPGVDYAKGMALANRIHNAGQATVWRGDFERAELYWEQLKGCGLTMAPLK
jgi:ATP-dependent Clp protease adapter protein ClpS